MAEKENSKGGKRPGSGRKRIGASRRIAITLPDHLWQQIDEIATREGKSLGEIFRKLVQNSLE